MSETSVIRNRVTVPLIAVGIAALASACGGSSGGNNASVGTNSGGGSTTASATSFHSGPDGKYVTDASGRTLYIFSADTSTTSKCSGACASQWPPYMSNGKQVDFKGHPLYYFAGDSATGDTNGEGVNNFGGLWTMVKPDGSALTMSQPSSAPSSSSGGGSSWG